MAEIIDKRFPRIVTTDSQNNMDLNSGGDGSEILCLKATLEDKTLTLDTITTKELFDALIQGINVFVYFDEEETQGNYHGFTRSIGFVVGYLKLINNAKASPTVAGYMFGVSFLGGSNVLFNNSSTISQEDVDAQHPEATMGDNN